MLAVLGRRQRCRGNADRRGAAGAPGRHSAHRQAGVRRPHPGVRGGVDRHAAGHVRSLSRRSHRPSLERACRQPGPAAAPAARQWFRAGRNGVGWRLAALPATAAGSARHAPAQGLHPPPHLQRAGAPRIPHARCPGDARLSLVRGSGGGQQHHRSGAVGAGGRALRPPRCALPLLPSGRLARLQGRCPELRPAADRRGRRDRRRAGQRLHGLQRLAALHRAAVRAPRARRDAVAAGLPRQRRLVLQAADVLGIRGVLPARHGHSQRTQRHHPARYHVADPQAGTVGRGRLGRMVHL